MINLLPPELKQNYRYARYNRWLVLWSLAFLLAILGVVAITANSLYVMNNVISTGREHNTEAKAALARQDIKETEKQVTDISSNLKLMVTVLSKEILFSKLLAHLGSITPPDVVLTNLSISQTESAVDITAQTRSYEAATQLHINLADPENQIFSKADIVTISCPKAADTNPEYPCAVSIRALFMADNPFLFINDNDQKAGA